MFCGKCGKDIPEDMNFCIHCGASLTPMLKRKETSNGETSSEPASSDSTSSTHFIEEELFIPDLDLEEGYGKVLSRKALSGSVRELCTCASLIVTGFPRQLHSHLRGALNLGCSEEQLREVLDKLLLFQQQS